MNGHGSVRCWRSTHRSCQFGWRGCASHADPTIKTRQRSVAQPTGLFRHGEGCGNSRSAATANGDGMRPSGLESVVPAGHNGRASNAPAAGGSPHQAVDICHRVMLAVASTLLISRRPWILTTSSIDRAASMESASPCCCKARATSLIPSRLPAATISCTTGHQNHAPVRRTARMQAGSPHDDGRGDPPHRFRLPPGHLLLGLIP
jgi:hypothetical protein